MAGVVIIDPLYEAGLPGEGTPFNAGAFIMAASLELAKWEIPLTQVAAWAKHVDRRLRRHVKTHPLINKWAAIEYGVHMDFVFDHNGNDWVFYDLVIDIAKVMSEA